MLQYRQPTTDANWHAHQASQAAALARSGGTQPPADETPEPEPAEAIVDRMANWLNGQNYVTQKILDRAFTAEEQKHFPAARDRALELSGDLH